MKIKSQIGSMQVDLGAQGIVNTPEINMEFEGSMQDVIDLYNLQKTALKETPELLKDFSINLFKSFETIQNLVAKKDSQDLQD